MPNPTPRLQNTLPPPIRNLGLRELCILTKIPAHRIESFISGEFKPNIFDRERLTNLGRQLHEFIKFGIEKDFVNRAKYRIVKPHLSLGERERLLTSPGKILYGKRLDALIERYWDQIILGLTEK